MIIIISSITMFQWGEILLHGVFVYFVSRNPYVMCVVLILPPAVAHVLDGQLERNMIRHFNQ